MLDIEPKFGPYDMERPYVVQRTVTLFGDDDGSDEYKYNKDRMCADLGVIVLQALIDKGKHVIVLEETYAPIDERHEFGGINGDSRINQKLITIAIAAQPLEEYLEAVARQKKNP